MEKIILRAPRWAVIVVAHILFYSLYFLTNRNPLLTPHTLPFLGFEEQVPLIGWTSYIYLSMMIQVPLMLFLIPHRYFGRTMIAVTITVVFHIICFVLFPTTYPRAVEATGYALFDWFRKGDLPNNCLPSLHVATSSLLALIIWKTRGNLWGIGFGFWSLAIAISTITTKQHYIIDVLLAWIVVLAICRIYPPNKIVDTDWSQYQSL